MRTFYIAIAALVLSGPAASQTLPTQQSNPQIDYDAFVELSVKLAEVRQNHLLPLEEFVAKSATDDAIILDTRSAEAFRLGHLDGAVNLPFSDFTSEKLLQVLGGDQSRPILIYCNNNFSDNRQPVALKLATLALNIPTFINLHGYGYTNVWELDGIVSTKDVDWIA